MIATIVSGRVLSDDGVMRIARLSWSDIRFTARMMTVEHGGNARHRAEAQLEAACSTGDILKAIFWFSVLDRICQAGNLDGLLEPTLPRKIAKFAFATEPNEEQLH